MYDMSTFCRQGKMQNARDEDQHDGDLRDAEDGARGVTVLFFFLRFNVYKAKKDTCFSIVFKFTYNVPHIIRGL